MKRVIITGATGVIGLALLQELIENKIEVLVICREDSTRNNRIPKHPLVKTKYCDLKDLAELKNDTDFSYDVFYHFAWEGTTGAARNDMYLQERNIRCSLDAVCAAKRFGCHTFIGAGSQAEYGRVEGMLKPDTPVFPETGYGFAKLCSGLMTREHACQMGLRHIWVRILSVYGPNDGMQSLVMSVINAVHLGISPKCTKGEQKWDYLYSKDAARAFRLIGEAGVDKSIYVLGRGEVHPLSEYIDTICKTISPNGKADLGAIPYAPQQVMYLGADISALKKDVGFAAQYSFEEGIKETIRWFKENN